MLITAILTVYVDTLRVFGMILGGGALDGVQRGVGVAGAFMGGDGGILGGAGVQTIQGRDGIIHRDGDGLTMRDAPGWCYLLALASPIIPVTTIGRVLTLRPAEAQLTRHLEVQ